MKKSLDYYKAWIREYTRRLDVSTPRSPFNFYVMNRNPLIIFTITHGSLANLFYMSDVLSLTPATFIVGFTWDISAPKKSLRVAREYREYIQRFSATKQVMFLCNSQQELDALAGERVPCIFANRSIFQDESIFVVHEVERQYPAILNSRMGRYKRIELAQEIDDIAIITSECDHEYMAEMRRCFRSAKWLNYRTGIYTRLSAHEVAVEVSRAHTGLILSRQEGHCNASIEYLLCGTPVVSTPSSGGRDMFYDEEYTIVVDADPQAVKKGVAELIDRHVDPNVVRNRTLERLDRHRKTLVRYLNSVLVSANRPPRTVEEWFSKWNNKMKFFCEPSSFEVLVHSDYFERDVFYSTDVKAREAYPDLFLAFS